MLSRAGGSASACLPERFLSEAWRQAWDFWQKASIDNPQVADFLCPLTAQIMMVPACAEDGFNYEREAITKWLEMHQVSPQTKEPMGKTLKENKQLEYAIKEFLKSSGKSTVIEWYSHGMHDQTVKRTLTLEPDMVTQNTNIDRGATTMSEALSQAFIELDPLRELLQSVLDGWTPPKIVIIGDECAGKSTLLEQLSMLPVFPRKKNFCTRVAIHVRLRRHPRSKATLRVCNMEVPGQMASEITSKEMPQENGWLWVQEEMKILIDQVSASNSTGIVKDKTVVLEVQRPDVPSIDLVDLPGLVQSPEKKRTDIEELLKHQIQLEANTGNNMYLVVVPGNAPPNLAFSVRFIQANQLEDRTFGVFTKCDMCQDSELREKLVSYLTGKDSKDGESPESLGAIPLRNGWVATMLKAPGGEAFKTHNFERLLMQQKADADWFPKHPEFAPLVNDNLLGVQALVRRLEGEYHRYLNTTWRDDAMNKVLDKLDEKKFELKMLGIVNDEDKKSELAAKEVERRWGPDSPGSDLYYKFLKDKIKVKFCTELRTWLRAKTEESWEGDDVNERLQSIKTSINEHIEEVVRQMSVDWIDGLQDILLAESRVDASEESSGFNISLFGQFKTVLLSLFEKPLPKKEIQQRVTQKPLIQLSQYKEYTDKIMIKCKTLFEESIARIRLVTGQLSEQVIDPNSRWLRLEPLLVRVDAEADITKVKPVCDVDGVLNALVVVLLRNVPSRDVLTTIHNGVRVGSEREAASQQHLLLAQEIDKIRAARDGIRRALSINDSEFSEIKNKRGEVKNEKV